MEEKTKKILIGAAIATPLIGIGYGVYKALSNKTFAKVLCLNYPAL